MLHKEHVLFFWHILSEEVIFNKRACKGIYTILVMY